MKKLFFSGTIAAFFIGCGANEPKVATLAQPAQPNIEQTKISQNFSASDPQACTTGCMDAITRAQEAQNNKNIKK